jgi:hypothetical protein
VPSRPSPRISSAPCTADIRAAGEARFAAGYAEPSTLADWLMEPDKAAAYLDSFWPSDTP